jgi:hypothetical protein
MTWFHLVQNLHDYFFIQVMGLMALIVAPAGSFLTGTLNFLGHPQINALIV